MPIKLQSLLLENQLSRGEVVKAVKGLSMLAMNLSYTRTPEFKWRKLPL